MKKPLKFQSLSRRIVIQFCVFTFVISLMYSLISFIFMYTLEDSFIIREIAYEADYLVSEYKQTGRWPSARKATMSLHFSRISFPMDIRERAIEEPQRAEFFGENEKHYHSYALPEFEEIYLLAEVSDELLVRKIRASAIRFLIISALIITAIACLMAWFIGRKTARSLGDLAALVDGLEPEQIPDQFSQHFPNNEIGILAKKLEQAFLRTKQAITREKCFTRDVSHELRTPLAVIKNALELRDQQINPSTNKDVFHRISEAAEQIDRTVDTLLILAREKSAKAEKQAVHLMAIIERSVLDNRIFLESKELEIHISDNCNTHILVQPGMLKVLLDNLLSNAFQYTAEGKVVIDYINQQLSVKDTGLGIDQDISDKITEAGIKGSQSTGFGFGLSIVKRLCDHQAWSLSVESGEGTKVSVYLP